MLPLTLTTLHDLRTLYPLGSRPLSSDDSSFPPLTPSVREELHNRQEEVLNTVVGDVAAFKTIMRNTGAIIAGSLALKVFSPEDFQPGNADLFVANDAYDTVRQYLIQHEGYNEGKKADNGHGLPHIQAAAKGDVTEYGAGMMRGSELHRDRTPIVRLYGVRINGDVNSAVEAVTFSWTTLLMNFVTADGACCGYPAMTLRSRGLWHYSRCADGPFDMPINKYTQRGFNFARHPRSWLSPYEPCPRDSNCPFTERHFKDSASLFYSSNSSEDDVYDSFWVFGGVQESVHL